MHTYSINNGDSTPSSGNNNNQNQIIPRERRGEIERDRFDNSGFGIPRIFRHFFEPEYDKPTLSDVNTDIYNHNHGPIINDEKNDSNLIHPNGPPPGFRSPYLPNWNGQEKSISNSEYESIGSPQSQSFFRSQSVTIRTGPDGKTTKTTTIRDENGNVHESTETFDSDGNGTDGNTFGGFGGFGGFDFPRRMIDFGFGHNDDNANLNSNPNSRPPSLNGDILNDGNPWVTRPNDPFGRWRNTIDGWKNRMKGYWFGGNDNGSNNNGGQPRWFNWKGNDSNGGNNNNGNNSEWFWKYRNDDNNGSSNGNNGFNNGYNGNNENNKSGAGRIEWKSRYNDYRRRNNGNEGSKLRDQIVKPSKNDDQD